MNMITKHVEKSNPIMQNGAKRNKNQNRPFFMYLSWRAPHRPMSHDWEFDQKKPWDHMPYVAQGKPGEQLGIFDEYIGTFNFHFPVYLFPGKFDFVVNQMFRTNHETSSRSKSC